MPTQDTARATPRELREPTASNAPTPSALPKKAVVFGGGAVGRGFVGPLFTAAGWQVTFLDIDQDLVERLSRDGGYDQIIVDNQEQNHIRIAPIRAVSITDTEAVIATLTDADIAAISVGAANLPHLAPLITDGLKNRERMGRGPLDFLLCENLHDAPAVLRTALDDVYGGDTSQLAGLAATSIGRMIPGQTKESGQKGTTVFVEPYARLPYDATALRSIPPDAPGFVAVGSGFEVFSDRKLYVHNMGHCMLALLADYRSLSYVWEAVEQLDLRYLVRAAMVEAAAAVALRHRSPFAPLMDHVNDLLDRFGNRGLGDTAQRVGRDLVRKMRPDDRLLGAYVLCRRSGVAPLHISLAVALGARGLELKDGWSANQVDRHLDEHLFAGSCFDASARQLLWDQRALLSQDLDVAAQIARIDREVRLAQVV